MSYLPALSDTPSRWDWVEFSTTVMCVCPSSLPDGSVTVPVKPLRSTCAMPGIAHERDKIVETINTDGENKERNFCMLASKKNCYWRLIRADLARISTELSANSAVSTI